MINHGDGLIGIDIAPGNDQHVEIVPKMRAIWQTDNAKTYRCSSCHQPIFSQYEGDERPTVECLPDRHVLRWVR